MEWFNHLGDRRPIADVPEISIDFKSISSKSQNIFSNQNFFMIKLALKTANLLLKNGIEKKIRLDEIELKSIDISGTCAYDHLPNKGSMTFI